MKIGLTSALNQPVPQIATITERMIHGTQARKTSPRSARGAMVGVAAPRGAGCVRVPTESSRERRAGEVQISFGCQIRMKPTRHAMQISDAPMSTIQGLT